MSRNMPSISRACRGSCNSPSSNSSRWGQYAERSRLPLRWVYAIEHRRFFAYEQHIARTFSHALVCTATERRDFERLIPGVPVSLVGNGVDLDYFRSTGLAKRPASIVFTGVMDYFPNIDARRMVLQ